jgi:hypothetical protein
MRFSTDLRLGSDDHESSLLLDAPVVCGGGFFLIEDVLVVANASKGETKSNIDLRGEGG